MELWEAPEDRDREALHAFLLEGQAANERVAAVASRKLADSLRAAKLDGSDDLARLDAAEIWLAAGCADGVPEAVQAFDAQYISRLTPALRALGLDAAAADELRQRVRERLLTSVDGGPIRLLEYAGKGRLFGLVKVVAVRMTLDDKRRAGRAPDRGNVDQMTVERVMDGELGPELAVIETQHRGAVKNAFRAAIEALEPKQRGVLRLHLLQGSSIDEIAALYGVHRATAARWIVGIREELGQRTREALRSTLGLDDAGLDSLLDAVGSRLDLSLSRVLSTAKGAGSTDSE